MGFLSNLIDTISSQYNINQDKIYSTGMSNGGFMSYKLAPEFKLFNPLKSDWHDFTLFRSK